MRFFWILFFLFTSVIACAGNNGTISLAFFNLTATSGTATLNNTPLVSVPNNGFEVDTTAALTGKQGVGLQVGSVISPCYVNEGQVMLNAALYKGDVISIIYGQPQLIPPGVACGCYGSACDAG